MGFSSAIVGRDVIGSKVRTWGTYTNSSSTGGDIDTGIHSVDAMFLQPTGASVSSNAPAINETFPVAGSAVTIVTDNNEAGIWQAYGDYF